MCHHIVIGRHHIVIRRHHIVIGCHHIVIGRPQAIIDRQWRFNDAAMMQQWLSHISWNVENFFLKDFTYRRPLMPDDGLMMAWWWPDDGLMMANAYGGLMMMWWRPMTMWWRPMTMWWRCDDGHNDDGFFTTIWALLVFFNIWWRPNDGLMTPNDGLMTA